MNSSKRVLASVAAQIALGLALVVLLQGCASGGSVASVPRASTGKLHQVTSGTVVATRTVVIDGEGTYLGRSSGAVMGTAIGQTAGSGSGRVVTAAAGAVVGGLVGNSIEKELTKKEAQELTVNLDDGGTVVVIQEVRDIDFIEGDRVNVMHTHTGEALVAHAHYNSDGLY